MKLTKREKEIVTALHAGARLSPPYGHCSHQWQLQGTILQIPDGVSAWIFSATIRRMKMRQVLTRDVDGRLVPHGAALKSAGLVKING